MELKHIQLDTLGHLVARHLLTGFHLTTTSGFYTATLKFYSANCKEVKSPNCRLSSHFFHESF